MKRERKPSWWKLNGLMMAMLAVLFLITTADVSQTVRQLLEIGAVLGGYGLVSVWIYSNADALEAEARRKQEDRRQSWYPAWWRPGLNSLQRHYLSVRQSSSRLIRKEVAK